MRAARRSGAFLAGLATLALPALAHATVLWTATFEKGDLSEWTSTTNGTKTLPDGTVRKNIEALGERVYSGSFAGKVTVHPDDIFGQYVQDRADIKHDSTLTGEGKDSYLSGYYYLPEDCKTRDEIAFYETKVTSRNWMDLWIEPKTGGGTTVKFGIESNGANLGSVLVWTGDWKAGQWHQFVVHVHWSTDATKGVVDLWFDGQQVVTGYKHKTKFDTNDMFFQTGIHRVLVQQFVESLYIDDFIEADTQAEAKIAAPTPGGGATDGGTTSDAAGTAGAGGAGGAAGAMGTGGATGTAGAGAGGATGTAGATSGTAGSTTTGAAGSTTAGTAGSTSGAAGSSTTGTAGATTTGTAGAPTPARSSGGCAYAAGASDASTLGLASLLALLGAIVVARRARR